MSDSEYWTSAVDTRSESGLATRAAAGFPATETIGGVRPLDAQLGIWPKKTVPDALYPWLFGPAGQTADAAGQPEPAEDSPPMNSFALLEAARAPQLPELLDRSELEWCSLFSGKAAQELREVAPYLVRISDDSRFTRCLFSNAGMPDDLWDAAPGIFLRSRKSLAELRRQFRRFTRIQQESGKWYYFRFWEIAALQHATSDAGADLFGRLWGGCRLVWRGDDEGGGATFHLR
ncbi:DUF4123 domain-containing protein [Paracoccus lutimaris]|uniref:Uncharacterized protein DUF4123 n=1 Tax=Paracoccus lutimaris TaxID=1490030 RepID=A0A368Z302_9RHOB|nr:DUF4123 domain-containing protein [Paracoccus lutimaris]RCW86791.1 uncharacterized protein DUF4123 [Paracoccus lutimaris]